MLRRRRLVFQNDASLYFAMVRCSYNLYGALLELRSLHTNPKQQDVGRKRDRPDGGRNIAGWTTCINQQDTVEKVQQVTAMGDIYNSAICVLTWLGKSDNFTTEAVHVVSLLAVVPEENTAIKGPTISQTRSL